MLIVRKAAPGVSSGALENFTRRARKATGLRGQVNVVLTSSRDIQKLNYRFRGKDKATDVLSFPPVQAVAAAFSGDIVISTDIAVRNARDYGHDPSHELKILILHGLLHLAGHDHETDSGQMARKEERLRRQLGLSNGLIGRAQGHVSASRRKTNGRGGRA
jgi:probable rRNA maturation factor